MSSIGYGLPYNTRECIILLLVSSEFPLPAELIRYHLRHYLIRECYLTGNPGYFFNVCRQVPLLLTPPPHSPPPPPTTAHQLYRKRKHRK